jgi:hypothetical protein
VLQCSNVNGGKNRAGHGIWGNTAVLILTLPRHAITPYRLETDHTTRHLTG